jgi:hypothetical protein
VPRLRPQACVYGNEKAQSRRPSLDEIKAAVGDPPPAQGRGPGFASFTQVVYEELTKKGA